MKIPVSARSFICLPHKDPEAARELDLAVFNNPFGPPPAESEDCLYLNVFAPSTPAPKDGRTVMVWIFGGGMDFGTANLDMYDGSSFASNQDVIIVAANYRTNGTSPESATLSTNS